MSNKELVEKRTSANKEVKAISSKNRDSINEFKQSVNEAKTKREERNKINEQIKELKEKREAKNNELKPLIEILNLLRSELKERGFENPRYLKEEIDRFEWILQTEPLKPRQEKELSKQISELRAKYAEMSIAREKISKLDDAKKKFRELKKQSEALHSKIQELAKESHRLHEEAVKSSKKADFISKEINAGMEELKEKKQQADEIHSQIIETQTLEEKEENRTWKAQEERKEKAVIKQKRTLAEQAKEILEKFKSGEKISTQEFLTLQESGLL
ncbi:MAG: hypothetical protein ABH803_00580 [Candidatus Micrarchaeota archaeon]